MRMHRTAQIALAIFLASLAGSAIASLFNSRLVAIALGLPALLLAVWTFFGHFVTLDDDMPDGFSNPDGSRRFYYRSFTELAVKGLILAATVWLIVYWPF